MEGVPQPRLRRASRRAEAAARIRRPQPVRARARARRRTRILLDRTPVGAVRMTSPAGPRFSTWRERIARTRVLVAGDVMLDRYWFGDVERISPEAPVPVVKVTRTRGAPRRGGQRRAQRGRARRADDAALRDRHRRARRRAGAPARDGARADVVPPRPGAVHHRQDAGHRPPAAAAAHRLRDRALARTARDQAGRFRPAARGYRSRHPFRLRQRGARAHRHDDRACPRRRQAGAGRSEGRRLGQVPRRHGDHAESRRVPPGRRPVAGCRRHGGQGARAARASSTSRRCSSRARRKE